MESIRKKISFGYMAKLQKEKGGKKSKPSWAN
jgi:hypothetical protein